MQRNTYFVILFLAILAALIVGLNIGKGMPKNSIVDTQTIAPSPSLSPLTPTPDLLPLATGSSLFKNSSGSGALKTASGSATAPGKLYTNAPCGISLTYPDTVTMQESTTSTNGVLFSDKTNPSQIIILTCQKDIPRPPLTSENIEDKMIGVVPVKLYHDRSQKDGTQIDALIFTHPKTKLDVFIGGYGATFNAMIQSLKIL